MEKEKLTQKEKDKRKTAHQKIKMLRGVITAGLAAVAMKTGDGKIMTAPEADRKTDPVTHSVVQECSPLEVKPNELPPDTIAMPEIKPLNMKMPQPTGIPIPEAAPKIPQINFEQEDTYNYDEIKQICEESHYEICTDLVTECEGFGYGKEKLAYEDKLELAGSACDVEMSQIMNENLLPAFNSLYQSMEDMSQVFDNYTNWADQNNRVAEESLKSDVRKIKKGADKSSGKCMKSYREMSALAKDAARIHRLSEQFDKTGEKNDESFLDKKIEKMYKHSQKYIKKYEKQENMIRIDENKFNLSKPAKKIGWSR